MPSALKSVVTVSRDTLVSGTLADVTLESRNQRGVRLYVGGHTVVFSASGGSSAGNSPKRSTVPCPWIARHSASRVPTRFGKRSKTTR